MPHEELKLSIAVAKLLLVHHLSKKSKLFTLVSKHLIHMRTVRLCVCCGCHFVHSFWSPHQKMDLSRKLSTTLERC